MVEKILHKAAGILLWLIGVIFLMADYGFFLNTSYVTLAMVLFGVLGIFLIYKGSKLLEFW